MAAEIAVRILAATVGCYYATYAAMFALAHLLPASPADAVLVTSMLSFLLGVPLALWIFAERSLLKLVLVLGISMALCAALAVMAT